MQSIAKFCQRGLSQRVTGFTRKALCGHNQFINQRFFSLGAHGTKNGELVNGLLEKGSDEYNNLWNKIPELESLTLDHRQTCDIELLLNGAFSPLEGFMTSDIYNEVVNNMHLPSNVGNGAIFPMPICLDITEEKALEYQQKGLKQIILRDGEHNPIAVMDIEDMWKPDKTLEAEKVFGGDCEHPAVHYLNNYTNNMYIGGKLHGFQLPPHYDYNELRKTPAELRQMFEEKGWDKIAAFQTRNPMHRAHIELTMEALKDKDMKLLIHPVVGMTKPGDIDHHTRVKCYKQILDLYPKDRTLLSVFPLAMRMAGPREAILHKIIRKNYGVTHFIVGRDHAGPGSNSKGEDFYGPYEARDAAVDTALETNITPLSFEMMVYSPEDDQYYPSNAVPEGKKVLKLSGTEVRKRLQTGEEIPEWFSYRKVVDILREAHPPKAKQGVTLLFTGLSGSGKSTIANALREKLMELQNRKITMLDGDYVRTLISSELGFSTEHRNLNIKRIGYISSLISNSGGLVIAAPIAPFKESRDYVREVNSQVGGYFEIFVSTDVQTCAQRDRKGLYKQAAEGKINLTGVGSERYDEPINPEITIESGQPIDEAVNKIINAMADAGYIQLDNEQAKLLE